MAFSLEAEDQEVTRTHILFVPTPMCRALAALQLLDLAQLLRASQVQAKADQDRRDSRDVEHACRHEALAGRMQLLEEQLCVGSMLSMAAGGNGAADTALVGMAVQELSSRLDKLEVGLAARAMCMT